MCIVSRIVYSVQCTVCVGCNEVFELCLYSFCSVYNENSRLVIFFWTPFKRCLIVQVTITLYYTFTLHLYITGATKMNAESSRSHSIFAIMVDSFDTATKRYV